MSWIAALVKAAVLAVLLAAMAPAALAQTAPAPATQAATGAASATTDAPGPDYATWERIATRIEALIANPETTDDLLNRVRAQLVDWRSVFQNAQNTNSTRIATLRAQIEALGPVPTEGTTEAPEIAQRRTELNDQLVRLQAPGLAADEAFRRADGLVREIDSLLRERQADELLQIWPSPLLPTNWPGSLKALAAAGSGIAAETVAAWTNPAAREEVKRQLPLIIFYMLIGLAMILRGRHVMRYFAGMMQVKQRGRWRTLLESIISFGQFLLPFIGVLAVYQALTLTTVLGPVGTLLLELLPAGGLLVIGGIWLGAKLFPREDEADAPLNLNAARRSEGRLLVVGFAVVMALEGLRETALKGLQVDNATNAFTAFPAMVLGGLIVYRLGTLLLIHSRNETAPSEGLTFRNRMLDLMGRAARLIGAAGPILAAIGYVPAASALIFPAGLSMGLMGLILVLQRWIDDIYAMIAGTENGRDALIPVLIGFALTFASLPLFALIWGARIADLTELWAKLREGFAIGETRISPTSFLVFLAVFAAGYMATKLLQGALKSSVLPRTKLDQGGQNAMAAMVGYVGLFLAGLIAINSAGIDLTGLAFVAGALSLGLGFGLQNIVSNFVSGIILLIERPVSEGDWIEVGGVQGTVKSISVRSTRIQTFDRSDVIVPNSELVTKQVTNWTRFSLAGRLIVPVGVAYGSDTREVERILREIAEAEPLAVMNPAPIIAFMGFGADAMNFEMRMILRDVNFSLSVRSDINHEIVRRFGEAGIVIPFSQREIWLHRARESQNAPSQTPSQPEHPA
jgi:small-conductance mechanosensitive channel